MNHTPGVRASSSSAGRDEAAHEYALQLSNIAAGYSGLEVLRGVDLAVPRKGVVAVLGANGAGKTTMLRVAAGLLKPTVGHVYVGGRDVTGRGACERARSGVCLIPEGRGIFRSLTVRENLELQIPPWSLEKSIEPAITAFPILGERSRQIAGSLSGGQQQMLALSRAFLCGAEVVLLDEVSMGLAPIAVDEIFAALGRLADANLALVIVEQYVSRALTMADDAYLISRGRIHWNGPARNVTPELLAKNYLGGDPAPGLDPDPEVTSGRRMSGEPPK